MGKASEPDSSGQKTDNETTVIESYGKEDSHIEEASGYSKVDNYPNKQQSCDLCGMVARNDEELQLHVRSTHNG
jgi:hypothetical protein